MKSVLAIDEGTTGSRALVIAEDGRVLGRGYREIPQHFPQPGWVEHEPEDLWRATLDACREALAQAQTRPDAIGITNQRETVCVWDRKTGKPIEPELPLSIGLIEDPAQGCSGPLWVRGGVQIESADGFKYEVRNRVTLCRCGQSQNKPFCDGTHAAVGFRDE